MWPDQKLTNRSSEPSLNTRPNENFELDPLSSPRFLDGAFHPEALVEAAARAELDAIVLANGVRVGDVVAVAPDKSRRLAIHTGN